MIRKDEINIYERQDGEKLARKIGKKIKPMNMGIAYSSCPICDPAGEKGNKYYFAAMDDGTYQCNKCGASGSFRQLVDILGISDLPGYEVMERKKEDENNLFFSEPDGGFKPSDDVIKKFKAIGYTEDFVRKSQIYEYSPQEDCRYAMPVRDINGKMIGYVFADRDCKWQDGFGKLIPYLIGMGNCKNRCGTLIITIGIDNYAAVLQAETGHDCVCVHDYKESGLHGLRNSMDFVLKYKDVLIVSSDNLEKSRACNTIEDIFSGMCKRILKTNVGDYGCNSDICKCDTDQIIEIINNPDECQTEYNQYITNDADDIEYVDVEKLPIGISCIDNMMYGGLIFGGVHVVTGKAGQGKTNICTKINLNAISNGYKTWVYSAEKDVRVYKGDLIRMSIRPGMSVRKTNSYGCGYYSISDAIKQKIRDWIGGNRILFYNNKSSMDVLNAAEIAIKTNGVKVLIVDNLMTAMLKHKTIAGKNTTQYERQANFVADLVDLAERYQVCIILVAHKSKRIDDTGTSGGTNDGISGASEIGNLAHTIISYDEPNKYDRKRIFEDYKEKKERESGKEITDSKEIKGLYAEINWPSRLMRVSKNRNGGRVNNDGFHAFYNKETSRVYCSEEDLFIHYGWELPDYGAGRHDATAYSHWQYLMNTYGDEELPLPDDDKKKADQPKNNQLYKKSYAGLLPGQMDLEINQDGDVLASQDDEEAPFDCSDWIPADIDDDELPFN